MATHNDALKTGVPSSMAEITKVVETSQSSKRKEVMSAARDKAKLKVAKKIVDEMVSM